MSTLSDPVLFVSPRRRRRKSSLRETAAGLTPLRRTHSWKPLQDLPKKSPVSTINGSTSTATEQTGHGAQSHNTAADGQHRPLDLLAPPALSVAHNDTPSERHGFQQFLHVLGNLFCPPPTPRPSVRQRAPHSLSSTTLLHRCSSPEEHYAKIRDALETARPLHGLEGLRALGFEYRLVDYDDAKEHLDCTEFVIDDPFEYDDYDDDDDNDYDDNDWLVQSPPARPPSKPISFQALRRATQAKLEMAATAAPKPPPAVPRRPMWYGRSLHHQPSKMIRSLPQDLPCHWSIQRLCHGQQEIDDDNRKRFIADGEMYEQVARLCQEYAQDVMRREADLVWHTVPSQTSNHGGGGKDDKSPIRMLISRDHPLLRDDDNNNNNNKDKAAPSTTPPTATSKPTLLVVTGRGKVRAGIFSRHHLLCDGLEPATAIPMIREATARGFYVIVLDPNVHGEVHGFATFQVCMDYLRVVLQGERQPCWYMLSHSASGGHLARYLLDKDREHLTHFAAVAFTDSTHNIQWARTQQQQQTNCRKPPLYSLLAKDDNDKDAKVVPPPLQTFLESDRCVYFRCANIRRNGPQVDVRPAGEPAQTDAFWRHRFGRIRTLWAGTDQHSLTNWYAHAKIWQHFDQQYEQQPIEEQQYFGDESDGGELEWDGTLDGEC